MSTVEQEVLAAILGQIDGLHEPMELTGSAQFQADWQRRQAYRDNGHTVPWQNQGDSPASRKKYSRARASLVADGLVVVASGNKQVGLTDLGMEAARRQCGLPVLADAMVGLDFLADSSNDPARWTGGELSEGTMAGLRPIPKVKIGEARIPDALTGGLMRALLPAIVENLIAWRTCRADGVFLFALSPSGQELARQRRDSKTEKPSEWPKLIRRGWKIGAKNAAAVSAYSAAWVSAWGARATAEPIMPNVIQHLDPVDAPEVSP